MSCLLRSGFENITLDLGWKHVFPTSSASLGFQAGYSSFTKSQLTEVKSLLSVTLDFLCSWVRNITRIAKAALQRCPGKSSLNAYYVFSCPVCLVFPICGIFLHRWWPNVSTMKCICRVLMAAFVRKLDPWRLYTSKWEVVWSLLASLACVVRNLEVIW